MNNVGISFMSLGFDKRRGFKVGERHVGSVHMSSCAKFSLSMCRNWTQTSHMAWTMNETFHEPPCREPTSGVWQWMIIGKRQRILREQHRIPTNVCARSMNDFLCCRSMRTKWHRNVMSLQVWRHVVVVLEKICRKVGFLPLVQRKMQPSRQVKPGCFKILPTRWDCFVFYQDRDGVFGQAINHRRRPDIGIAPKALLADAIRRRQVFLHLYVFASYLGYEF